ncbi:phosphotransferase family protein [Kribbella sp. NPDC059898]|uniref:phosphotransferase family protein n=1 Tax=Kribbella sp. NPDC059898 TaxID=3346995 RepID=UPI0036539BD5
MTHTKRRPPALPGSIPDVLNMFDSEVRFYREIAPYVGVRVPECYQAESGPDGTLLVLEDLSAWTPGADPVAGARALRDLHDRWTGQAHERWPWLRPAGAGDDLVADLYDRTWPTLATRQDLTTPVREFGERLVGKVVEAERAVGGAGPLTLVHGDASAQNMCTSPDGVIGLLDWEDVSSAPGILDLAWFLVSSVDPAHWTDTLDAYGYVDGLTAVLPSVAVQGYLSMSDLPDGSADGWIARLEAAVGML